MQEEISVIEKSPIITKKGIQRTKNNKAPGTDRIHGQMLKLFEENCKLLTYIKLERYQRIK